MQILINSLLYSYIGIIGGRGALFFISYLVHDKVNKQIIIKELLLLYNSHKYMISQRRSINLLSSE